VPVPALRRAAAPGYGLRPRNHTMTDEHEKLIEASSLGTPTAKRLRARTSDEDVAKVIDAETCPSLLKHEES
jgi:hypothetical protein